LESASPEFDLASVWDALPASGPFGVTAEAIDGGGTVLATAASPCQRIAPFRGPYRPAKCAYDVAGAKTVAWLLKHQPGGGKFPILFYSSYIPLLTTYVRTNPNGELAEQPLAQATKYGQEMLTSTTPADWTYGNVPMCHNPQVFQVARGGMAGMWSPLRRSERCFPRATGLCDVLSAFGGRDFLGFPGCEAVGLLEAVVGAGDVEELEEASL